MAGAGMRHGNRNLVRHELIYYLKVTDRQTGQELGRLGDIHLEGMLLLTPEPLPEQVVYDLIMELPKAMGASEKNPELPFQAQTLWNRPGPGLSNYYYNGLRFLNMDAQTRRIIKNLTEIFAMPGRDAKP